MDKEREGQLNIDEEITNLTKSETKKALTLLGVTAVFLISSLILLYND